MSEKLNTANADDYLTENFALCPNRGSARCVLPIPPRSLSDGMSKDMFKLEIQRLMRTAVPAEAGAQFNFWIAHRDMKKVEDIELRPDKPSPIFRDERGAFLNLWRPPEHPSVTDDSDWALDAFHEFMMHLVPDDAQRWWLIKWLAHKYQHPESRGVAVLMVAAYNVYGAGRGTLSRLIAKLFGDPYVRTIPWENIAGEGSQSQFNPWAAECVIVCVDEIGKKEGSGRHSQNRQIFETLKTKIDPGLDQMDVNVKHLSAVKRRVFFSTIAATNNKDAIAIPPDDRRFTVLENGEKMGEAMRRSINAVIGDRHSVAAIALYLQTIDLTGFDPFVPLDTDIKREMTEQHIAPIDGAIRDVVTDFTGELFSAHQVEAGVKNTLGLFEAAKYSTSMIATKVSTMFPNVRIGNRRLECTTSDGRVVKYSVYAKDMATRKRWSTKPGSALSVEVRKNGHPVPDFFEEAKGGEMPVRVMNLPGVGPIPPCVTPC